MNQENKHRKHKTAVVTAPIPVVLNVHSEASLRANDIEGTYLYFGMY